MIILIIGKIILFILLLCILCFFCGAETAITSLSNSYLRRVKENQIKYSKSITYWESHTQELMIAMIMGMSLSLVGMGVVLSSLSADISEYCNLKSDILNVVFPAFSIVLTLVIGNIFPKTLARYNAEKMGIAVIPMIIKFATIFKVIIEFLLWVSNKIIKLFGICKESQHIKSNEIDFLLSNENTSPLPDDSRELVSNIMDFAEMRISRVMVPLSEIFAVDIDLPKEGIIKHIIETQYSRVPVYRGNINNIVGIIYTKDLAVAWRSYGAIVFEDLIRPAYYAPENAKVNKILKEFKTGHQHITIVVDEYGSTIGIASIEDLLEEIVGDVWDEYDLKGKTIMSIGVNSYLIQAYESISNVNDELNIEIPEGNYTTVNGWILELFGRIPEDGEKIDWQDYSIEVQDADVKKVNRIVLKKK
ncbi:MAG: hemolysin family protein [Endomicrobium sp.]|nr:hemolysin family protein [Endomicrobium sp.]